MSYKMIMLAEDDPIVRGMYEGILDRSGYVPLTATSGTECLELMANKKPKAIILDVNMPDLNGIETCKRLRSQAKYTGPIIFLTGADDIDTVRTCLAAGGDDYILKSAQPNEFLRRVNRWVDGDLDALRSRGRD